MNDYRRRDTPADREKSARQRQRSAPIGRRSRGSARFLPLTTAGMEAAAPSAAPDVVPRLDPRSSELAFRGLLIRRRSRKAAPLEEAVLSAFQSAGWVPGLPNPFSDTNSNYPDERLTAAVRRLNMSLELDWLRFHVYAKKVWWEDRIASGTARDRPPHRP